MAHLPKSYRFESLTNPIVEHGPLWERFGHGIWGQAMILKCEAPRLYPMDLIQYDGTLYIIPAKPELFEDLDFYNITVIHDIDCSRAMCVDREKWFELNNEVHRMKHISIPKFVRPHGALL